MFLHTQIFLFVAHSGERTRLLLSAFVHQMFGMHGLALLRELHDEQDAVVPVLCPLWKKCLLRAASSIRAQDISNHNCDVPDHCLACPPNAYCTSAEKLQYLRSDLPLPCSQPPRLS